MNRYKKIIEIQNYSKQEW